MSEIKFDPETHRYTVNGKIKPSVTRIIGDVLKGEREEVEPSEAMIKGTIIHKTLEYLDKGILGEYDQRIKPQVEAWERFKKTYKVEILDIEAIRMANDESFVGTIDRIAMIGGRLTIIDIKTGKSYKEYPLQTAGYSLLVEGAERRMCVYLSDDGVPTVEEHENSLDIDIFKSLLKVWQWKKNKL